MKIKLSDFIAGYFIEKGIANVFTVTGGGAMHLNDSFGHNPGLRCVYNHHEQACAIAAEGYARVSGKVAAVCVTSGPGGTNALTGVMGAWVDSIPMFVVSGQVKFETTIKSVPHLKLRQLGDQEFNIIDSVKNMTKYAEMVLNADDILYHLESAWHQMTENRPGPVWLDIPLDIQAAVIETDNLKKFVQPQPIKLDAFTVADALELLKSIQCAKAPVIFAGTAIRNSGYREQFLRFAERLNIPVVTAWNAHDTIPNAHRLYCGRPGSIGNRGGNFVVQNADLLLVVGSQLNIRQISYNYKSFAQNAKIIVVDIDKNELSKPTLNIDKPINCDLRAVIDVCLSCEKFYSDKHSGWLQWAKKINAKYEIYNKISKKGKINPYMFMQDFSGLLNDNETIVCSNATACVVTFQALSIKPKQRLFTNSGCASMGYGLPAAIGAAVADKGKRVVCMEGDGSIMMNLQELMTAAYNNLNLKIVLFNNDGYHSIRQTQKNLFSQHEMCGVSPENGVALPEWEKVCNAFGINYFLADDPENYTATARRFLDSQNVSLLEVIVDKEQFFEPKLSSKVLPDGKIVSPPIDDMFPFLERNEYDKIKFPENNNEY